jgi:hypothetical protein
MRGQVLVGYFDGDEEECGCDEGGEERRKEEGGG